MKGRYLGLDPGERRIGVAVSDATGTIATPLEFLDRRTQNHEQRLVDLCTEWEIIEIVVGLAVSLDGTEGPAAMSSRAFGDEVAVRTGVSVVFHDERFTTVTAEQALLESGMKRKSRERKRDQIAAAVMLQSFLDGRRYKRAIPDESNT